MTHHPIRVLEDGTRVYSNGGRYKPKSLEERSYGVNKPDDPRAVRFHGQWFLPLEVLPDAERGPIPETISDQDAYDHMATNLLCRCPACLRPTAPRWRRKWLKDRWLEEKNCAEFGG